MPIRKAVFPVAGFGTRFLPATKATPKEMLPIVDKPLIQYAAEEAISAGISHLIFVTSSSKRAIEDHFDSNFELEAKLIARQNHELLQVVKNILPKGISCSYIRQPQQLGLGHAVLCAKPIINDEPFAVLLADDLIDAPEASCLQQMQALYAEVNASIVAVQQVPRAQTEKYGVVAVPKMFQNHALISGIVEKPHSEAAPSTLGVVGRYILTPAIFEILEHTNLGQSGEIQLTDAIAELLTQEPVYAQEFAGTRYDCGSKLGYLQATLVYGLKHLEVADDFRAFIKNTLQNGLM